MDLIIISRQIDIRPIDNILKKFEGGFYYITCLTPLNPKCKSINIDPIMFYLG